MIKVSIIVPVYNAEKYLKKCLDSCVEQTLKEIEVIIINDGSTDKSEKIASEYVKNYENFYLVTTKNRGLSATRNEGILLAKGKYLYFLDNDDWLDGDCLERCYNLAEKENLEIVTFDAKTVVEEGMPLKYARKSDIRAGIIDEEVIYTGYEFIEKYGKNKGNKVQAWLKFLRKDFVLENNLMFQVGLYYEDVAFHYACMLKVERMKYLPCAFYNRLYRENSIITSKAILKKLYGVYETLLSLLHSLEVVERKQGLFWLDAIYYYIKNLIHAVIGEMSRGEILQFIAEFTNIQKIQYESIDLFWKLSNKFSDRRDSELQVLRFINSIVEPLGLMSDEIKDLLNKILVDTEQKFLKKLPFDKNSTIGVYGGGNHAKVILNRYKEVMHSIEAKLIFIETSCVSYEKKFLGYDVINIEDVLETDIEEIVIMSYLHEDIMYENATRILEDKYNIIRLYDGDTYCFDAENYHRKAILEQLRNIPNTISRRIILMNVPEHTNIGDHLITYAEEQFLEEKFSNYEKLYISGKYYRENRYQVKRMINAWDIILVTGGGFLGSLWADGDNTTNIIQDFRFNKIVILPQSMYFEDDDKGLTKKERFIDEILRHSDVTVCFREKVSLKRAEEMFKGELKCLLLPDMALTLSQIDSSIKREGVIFCLRSDKESVLAEEEKKKVENYVGKAFPKIRKSSMHHVFSVPNEEKMPVIFDKLREFSSSELVVTDTLHCMICCAITATPCIAFNNLSGKVKGVYEWIKVNEYIMYIDKIEELNRLDIKHWVQTHIGEKYCFKSEEYKEVLQRLILKG